MKLQLVDSHPVKRASSVKALDRFQFQVQERDAKNQQQKLNVLVARMSAKLAHISVNVLVLVSQRSSASWAVFIH